MEFNAPGDKLTDQQEIVNANLAEYIKRIGEAKERGADILVSSEGTLNYNGKFLFCETSNWRKFKNFDKIQV